MVGRFLVGCLIGVAILAVVAAILIVAVVAPLLYIIIGACTIFILACGVLATRRGFGPTYSPEEARRRSF